ncbi:formyltransferase family protein [Aestuariispira insulae]|uniref:Formyl transferase-like protein n=1 Tax=Aestuariispira insulae TaxID=1461337 RepID=A0A3D9HSF3_9PROT|nr:formyltransferase family protein [Aestuariispira insulae]RED52432.1 formyl transferase-like protein [Aestuariispira insulae]
MRGYDIVLLCNTPEGEFLKDQILAHAPKLRIGHATDLRGLEKLSGQLAPHSRLIAFCTAVIVPDRIIQSFGGNCYNFHPAPPEYPGYRPSGFALYRGEHSYGVTAHRLIRQVDAGEIVAVQRFAIEPEWNNYELAVAAYSVVIDLFRALIPQLATTDRLLPATGDSWGDHTFTRQEYLAMKTIRTPLPQTELEARCRCFDGVFCPVP